MLGVFGFAKAHLLFKNSFVIDSLKLGFFSTNVHEWTRMLGVLIWARGIPFRARAFYGSLKLGFLVHELARMRTNVGCVWVR